MIKWLENWLDRRALIRKKRRLMMEALVDMKFIETVRGESLSFDRKKGRALLAIEKKKESPEESVIDKLAEQISDSESTQAEYQKLKRMTRELETYLDLV